MRWPTSLPLFGGGCVAAGTDGLPVSGHAAATPYCRERHWWMRNWSGVITPDGYRMARGNPDPILDLHGR
ncbi:hypothetical protein KCP70_24855 [Salmonella enterica subsp. enterica]|nr:hypothetical protein KCP70_24855 [Salmonella enterica subsp. enterica]